MNRLHAKCFIASGGLHLLLALIVFVCPAFLASKPKTSEVQPITFVPSILIDAPFAGGGNPEAGRPPAAARALPQPVVQPAPAPAPQPARPQPREVAPPKTEGESLEVAKPNTRKKMDFTLKPVTRPPKAKSASNETSAVDSQEEQRVAMGQKLLGQFDRSARTIGSGTSSAAKIEGDYGPGGGGPSYASYEAWVWSYFNRAWVRPEDASKEDATVEVTVSIASNGTVISKRISKRSGDAGVDASVQRMLDRVVTVERPFPEGAKDRQRTYVIPFNMKTSRGAA